MSGGTADHLKLSSFEKYMNRTSNRVRMDNQRLFEAALLRGVFAVRPQFSYNLPTRIIDRPIVECIILNEDSLDDLSRSGDQGLAIGDVHRIALYQRQLREPFRVN